VYTLERLPKPGTMGATPSKPAPTYPPEGLCSIEAEYEYTPLPTPTSIRLLTVESSGIQGIHCTLDVFDLQKNPIYIALSYTWGCPFADSNFEFSDDPSAAEQMHESYAVARKIPITCNGRRALVTRNLYEALQELSRAGSRNHTAGNSSSDALKEVTMMATSFWIDALCINQADLGERNAQVAIMGEIYSRATAVTVYLGRWLARTQAAMDLINYLANIPEERHTTLAKYDPTAVESFGSMGLQQVSMAAWRPLVSFLRRSWFHRIWVVQEFVFAKRVIMFCGSEEVAWDSINRASWLLSVTKWADSLLLASFPFTNTDARHAARSPGKPLAMLTSLRSGLFSHPPVWKGTEASSLLMGTRLLEASDPKDKIYGLLPILNLLLVNHSSQPLAIPDYGSEISQIFLSWAFRIMLADQGLWLLSAIEDETVRKVRTLPSWAPDWTTGLAPLTIMNYEASAKWAASGSLEYLAPRLEVGRLLALYGAPFGTITSRSLPLVEMNGTVGEFCSCLDLASRLPNPYFTNQGLTEVLSRTLIGNAAGREYPATEELVGNLASFLILRARLATVRRTVEYDPNDGQPLSAYAMTSSLQQSIETLRLHDKNGQLPTRAQFAEQLLELDRMSAQEFMNSDRVKRATEYQGPYFVFATNRRLFTTAKNLMGGGPKSVQCGDSIWILPGAKLPFILRQLENGNYKVVGEAYVHGMMHGEAIGLEGFNMREIVLE
jgi:Heterokaryon incompatibility protein (HET)